MRPVVPQDTVDIFGQPINLAKNSRCYYEAPKSAVAEFAQRPLYMMTPGAFLAAYMKDERKKNV